MMNSSNISDPICSNCEDVLQRSTNPMQEVDKELVGWYGTICTECHTVYCQDCQDVDPLPCPSCGATLKPAIYHYLKQINPTTLPSDKKFGSAKESLLEQQSTSLNEDETPIDNPYDDTRYYLSDSQGRRFQGAADDHLGKFSHLTHDCPYCEKNASTGRSLVWIASECIKNEQVQFPCNSCSKLITIPAAIFHGDGLRKLERTSIQNIERMSPEELLKPNWVALVIAENMGEAVDVTSLTWDGEGSCPGCGHATPQHLSQKINCVECQAEYWIDQDIIEKEDDSWFVCPSCGKTMIIPATVWCQVCAQNLRPDTEILRIFQDANTQEEPLLGIFAYRPKKVYSSVI